MLVGRVLKMGSLKAGDGVGVEGGRSECRSGGGGGGVKMGGQKAGGGMGVEDGKSEIRGQGGAGGMGVEDGV